MPRPKKDNRDKKVEVRFKEKREGKVPQRLLGAKDILASDYKYWQAAVNKIVEMAGLYGFGRTEAPVMESAALYKKSLRNFRKEIYSWNISKTDKVSLRPDLTTGLARVFLENLTPENLQPVKMFSLGPVFRQETKVQTGNYRQFNQFALEIFNENRATAEVLLIFLAYNIFKELQLDVRVEINSVGNVECQKEFLNKLNKFYKDKAHRAKLCPDCKKAIQKNVLDLFKCEHPSCQEIRREAPQITSFLSEESNAYFTKILEYLDELNVNYNFNPFLVDELNYYTETVFEIWPLNEKGELDGKMALGRGGRYNNLLEQMGGRDIPAAGFAAGLERLVLKLKEKNLLFKKDDDIVFIAQSSDQARIRAMALFDELYKSGYKVRQAFTVDSLKDQLEEAKNVKAKIVLMLGKKEVSSETILYRDVELGVQEVITQKDLKEKLNKRFKN